MQRLHTYKQIACVQCIGVTMCFIEYYASYFAFKNPIAISIFSANPKPTSVGLFDLSIKTIFG